MVDFVEKYLLIFFVYSIAGWVMESIRVSIRTKKWVNRGFLIGPYLPIYGVGVDLVTLFLEKYVNDVVTMFFMSMIVCGTLEYCTSYVMEKVFHARWWDYSKRFLNLNGRICIETLVPFGLGGVVFVKYANPYILMLLNYKATIYVLIGLSLIFIVDLNFSVNGILGFRKEAKQAEEDVKDNTVEISSQMRGLVNEKIEETKEITTSRIETLQNATSQTINKLRESASTRITETRHDIKNVGRRIKITRKKAARGVRYTGKKLYNNLLESTSKIKTGIAKSKEELFNKLAIERIKARPWRTRRLLDAFPDVQIKMKDEEKEENKK